jgi:hypothetical protein
MANENEQAASPGTGEPLSLKEYTKKFLTPATPKPKYLKTETEQEEDSEWEGIAKA